MRIYKRPSAIRAVREILLSPLGAIAGLHLAVSTWRSSRVLLAADHARA